MSVCDCEKGVLALAVMIITSGGKGVIMQHKYLTHSSTLITAE